MAGGAMEVSGVRWHAPVPPAVVPTQVLHRAVRSGPLESRWLGVAFVGLVVALAALALTSWRRSGRRRRFRVSVISALAALSAVCAALVFVNAYVGYAPDLRSVGSLIGAESAVSAAVARRSPTRTAHGLVAAFRLGDAALGVAPGVHYVYLPPGYDPRAAPRYPVVYLFHGYPGTSSDWIRAGRLQQTLDALIGAHLVRPLIAVAPEVNGGWLHDSECLDEVGGPHVATFLTRDVVAYVDRHFRTVRSWRGRAVGGMSSGGYCALNLGLLHQREFGGILGLEPYGDPGKRALVQVLHGDPHRFAQNAPRLYLPKLRFLHPMPVFLDAGTRNLVFAHHVSALGAELRRRGQPVLFRLELGQAHTWREARAGAPYGLVFLSRYLRAPRSQGQTRNASASNAAIAIRGRSPRAAKQTKRGTHSGRNLALKR